MTEAAATWTDETEIPFGPFKGRRMRELPTHYMELLNKCPWLVPKEHFESFCLYLQGLRWILDAELEYYDRNRTEEDAR